MCKSLFNQLRTVLILKSVFKFLKRDKFSLFSKTCFEHKFQLMFAIESMSGIFQYFLKHSSIHLSWSNF